MPQEVVGKRARAPRGSRLGNRRSTARCLALLACCGALGAGMPDAAAEGNTFEAGSFFPLSGPSLAGGDVAWAERGQRGEYTLVRRRLGGGQPRRLRRAVTNEPNRFIGVSLAAGPEHTLVYEQTITRLETAPPGLEADGPPPPDVLAVSNAGTIETLAASCRCFFPLDFSGSIGLYPVEGGQTLRDFASPPSFQPTTFPRTSFQRAAGDYVVSAFTDVVVFDWRRGEEVYRLEDVTAEPRSVRSVDVQPDGKVAFAYEVRGEDRTVGRLGWASPAEPFVHPLPVTGSVSGVRFDSDVVVFDRTRSSADGGFETELGAVALNGPERTLVRPVERGSFDFDGTTVTWAERGCEGPLVGSATLDELSAGPRLRVARDCPLKLARAVRFSRNRRLVVTISCAGFSYDCTHRRRVVRTARAYRVAGRRVPRGTRINVPNRGVNAERRVRLRLTKTGRLLLARRNRTRLRLSLTLGDFTQNNTGDEFTERRTTRITVP